MAMATMPGSARTEITFSLCVVRNSERRFSTCSTVRLALPWNFSKRSVRRQGFPEELRLKLELLQRALAATLDLLQPLRIRRAVLCRRR